MVQPSDTLAAIDVGTNSFHLVVVRLLEQKQFSLITKEKAVVRLGESPSQIKRLSDDAIERGVEAMKIFRQIAALTDSPIRAVATSAVREATNRDEFIARVREETGIEIEVVSGFEEARLIYLGALQALPIYNERVTLFDIGGGSTEFVIGHQGRIHYANSFKIGAIRITQRCFPDEAVTREQLDRCRLFIRGEIYHAVEEIRRNGTRTAIASSGTAQTVASMILAMRGEVIPESLNGVIVTHAEVRAVLDRVIAATTHAERAALPGVDPRRADILVAGCLVLETILSDCGFSEYMISSYALREGIILDTIQKSEGDHETAHLSDLRYETVMKIGRMYSFDEPHARHVADLSLEILDALAELHPIDDPAREWLEAAALLHDIGYYISHSGHHKHSQYLIQNGEMLGFNNEEIAIIANVARYHRKSHPKKTHPEFAALPREDQQIVRRLAGILRVADGLDRTHKGNVEAVDIEIDDASIAIRPICREGCNPTFEIWSASRKKGLMEEAYGRDVSIASVEPVESAEG
ncbi:MAG TPA: Ppx/GppA phosphatase family protein [Candidatus Kapabacteria bacterium]|jgi:exopolyphosphatase/guanosine-5'-triphosphate,3'-diphosphate pyrophosphatase|nr:Ppx/GppA phosphatase family protein [Candidatus Kapabacteria bacterium]